MAAPPAGKKGSRRLRRLLGAVAALLLLLAAAIAFGVWWNQFGPGLDREAERLAAVLELGPGMTVAEIGAGKGRLAVRIARRLGPSGRLYATEIDARNLEAIRERAASAGLANITPVQAGERSSGLPDACCDAIYMRRVYHHLSDPAAINLPAALRPAGRLAVIDFLSPRWLFFIRHGIVSEAVGRQLDSAGFTLERRVNRWSPIDYCLVFRKRRP